MTGMESPRLVDWALTPKCNLHCRHCRGMAADELPTDVARKVIDGIAALQPPWVIVEGGEPLLRTDLFELLELMRNRQLEVHLISNGMLLDPRILSTLKGLGVRVMVSIDGATAATYEDIRGGASFETVVRNARRYAAEGLLEALNFTIMKTNYEEIPGLFELARSIGAPKITFIGFKPCHGYLEELLTSEEYAEAAKLACLGAEKTGLEFFFDEPFFWPLVRERGLTAHLPGTGAGILSSATSACIFGEYLFIDTNGDVRPCSFAPLVLGNVKEKPIDEIWREVGASPFFKELKAPESRTGHCRSCQHLVECKGCRSRTFMLTGDWFASDPCCPLGVSTAKKTGGKR